VAGPVPTLPIDGVLDTIREAVAATGRVVVAAAPGSGKTTRVPMALATDRPGRVVVLEPRRVAARAMARFLAARQGEPVGGFVGLTTRDERQVSDRTRVEFVTEGVLTRRLQRDPELTGVHTVVFDEFHERSLAADTGLALTLDAAAGLRPDLAVVVMSATLDVEATAALLGDAVVVRAAGAAHPVETHYRPRGATVALANAVAAAVSDALADGDGDVLVFLDGAAEIRRVERALEAVLPASIRDRLDVLALHGQLPPAQQDRALAAAPPGRRKVVLATNVAETSVTVDGVRAVVDAGLVRRVRTASGAAGTGRFTQLVTERISQAEAEQRRGRAGRQGPGRCYRLWAERDHAGLRAAPRPEIAVADLCGLALELAGWGVTDPGQLAWLDPPPADALAEGRATLAALGLVEATGRPTDAGAAVLRLGVDPRAGAIVLAGRAGGTAALRTACRVAALLEEGELFVGRTDRLGADLGLRLDALDRRGTVSSVGPAATGEVSVHEGRRRRASTRAATLEQRVRRLGRSSAPGPSDATAPDGPGDDELVAALLLAGMADRIAQRREDGSGRYVLRSGGGVRLDPHDPLARSPFILVADAGGPAAPAGTGARGADRSAGVDLTVRSAVALPARLLPPGRPIVTVRWDPTVGDGGDVSARREERLDALVVSSGPLSTAALEPGEATPALLEAVRRHGWQLLGGLDRAEALRQRVAFCRRTMDEASWPDLSDEALLAGLDTWLAPLLHTARRRRDLATVDCRAAWWAMLDPAGRACIDRLAPAAVTIPTGRSVPIDYAGERPTLSVKLQELFGLRRLPELADGRQRLVAQLLSPAGRPVAVTDDLERFWTGAYRQVRSELRGRYPKHPWPEDPLAAAPTAATNRRAGLPGGSGGTSGGPARHPNRDRGR